MDVEGSGGISGNDCIRMTKSPFQPDVEEMSLDPTVAVFRVFEEIQFVNLQGRLAGLRVCISFQRIE
jgi:hypothetical protein